MDVLNRKSLIIEMLSRSALWAIAPQFATRLILSLLRPEEVRANGIIISTWEAAKPSMLGKGANRVAVIPIQGVLTSDGPPWFGTNYKTITDAADQAATDASVKRIVLSVDSPGGEVTGLPETASVLAQVAKIKPVSAVVDGTSASAAYWLTSQAHDVTLTPSGEVGSVGVRMMHVDISKMLEDMGCKITELQSGAYKTEWSPYKPLSEEAKADMQTRLEDMHAEFIQGVKSGRGNRATSDIQKARFGEGRMFSSQVALGHGLVDKIQPARDFYAAITPVEESTPAPAIGMPRRARLEIERHRF